MTNTTNQKGSSATSGCLDKLEALANAGAPVALRAETLRDLIALARRIPAPQAATPLPEQDERALFEHAERASNLARDGEGDYENPCVQSSWEGWQARACLTQQAAPGAPASEQARAAVDMAKPCVREVRAAGWITLATCERCGKGPCTTDATPAATTASTSEPVSKAELWDAIHQHVSDYGDQFREPPTTGAGKRCDASRNELAETIDRLYRAAAPSREAAPQIKTWQERYSEARAAGTGPRVPMGLTEMCKDAEIADLRTALAQQGAAQGGTARAE